MFKRDVELMLTKLKKSKQADGTISIIANEKLFVHIPKTYEQRNLATFGERATVMGVFAMIDENNNYTVSLAPSLVVMEPSTISSVKINDEDYYNLIFEKGDKIIVDNRIAKEAQLIYHAYATFISGGYVPWFLDDTLLSTLFSSLSYFTEKKFSPYASIAELIISAMTRNPENIDETYRNYINQLKPGEKPKPPEFISLKNFAITANSKLNKFLGSHFEEGLTGALTSTTYEPTVLEQVLRQ